MGETWMHLWDSLEVGWADWWLIKCGYEGEGTIKDIYPSKLSGLALVHSF